MPNCFNFIHIGTILRGALNTKEGLIYLYPTDHLTFNAENLFEEAYTGILIFPVKLFILCST